jgi:hypothetical protein
MDATPSQPVCLGKSRKNKTGQISFHFQLKRLQPNQVAKKGGSTVFAVAPPSCFSGHLPDSTIRAVAQLGHLGLAFCARTFAIPHSLPLGADRRLECSGLFEIGMRTNPFAKLLEDSHHALHPQLNLLGEKSTQTEAAKIRQDQGRKDGRNSATRPNEQFVRLALSALQVGQVCPACRSSMGRFRKASATINLSSRASARVDGRFLHGLPVGDIISTSSV